MVRPAVLTASLAGRVPGEIIRGWAALSRWCGRQYAVLRRSAGTPTPDHHSNPMLRRWVVVMVLAALTALLPARGWARTSPDVGADAPAENSQSRCTSSISLLAVPVYLSLTDVRKVGCNRAIGTFTEALTEGYNRARYLDQNLGRFWSSDMFLGISDSPKSLHKYTYCSNDSLNHIDPSGYFFGSIAEAGATMGAWSAFSAARILPAWGGRMLAIRVGTHLSTRALLYQAYGDLAGYTLGFVSAAYETLANNTSKIQMTNSGISENPGPWIEQKVGANATGNQSFDHHIPGEADISFKSNKTDNPQSIMTNLRKDLKQYRAAIAAGPIPMNPGTPGQSIDASGSFIMFRVIREDAAIPPSLWAEVREFMRREKVTVIFAPLRGWGRK